MRVRPGKRRDSSERHGLPACRSRPGPLRGSISRPSMSRTPLAAASPSTERTMTVGWSLVPVGPVPSHGLFGYRTCREHGPAPDDAGAGSPAGSNTVTALDADISNYYRRMVVQL